MRNIRYRLKAAAIFFIIFGNGISGLSAQAPEELSVPQVNTPVPAIQLRNLEYYEKPSISLKDLAGNYVILDFFTPGCSACFESFPKINRLQQEFASRVKIFLIGSEDHNLSAIYTRFREKQKLQLPVAFDASLFQTFGVRGVPYLIWIDRGGMIKAISPSTDLTEKNLNAFLSDSPFEFQNMSRSYREKAMKNFDSTFILNLKPFQGLPVLSGSSMTSWNSSMPVSAELEKVQLIRSHWYYQLSGVSVNRLINFAFAGVGQIDVFDSLYGQIYPSPIYETTGEPLPIPNLATGEGLYCYAMITDSVRPTKAYLQKRLQNDLNNYLGYDIHTERRMMPYWRLIALPGAAEHLKSKFTKTEVSATWAGLKLQCVPIQKIVQILEGNNQLMPPFVDETQITENIDLDLDALQTDFEDLKRVLYQNGIALVKGQRMIKVIVVRKSRPVHE